MSGPDLDLTSAVFAITEKTLRFAFGEFQAVHDCYPNRILLNNDQSKALADAYHATVTRYIKDREFRLVETYRGVPIASPP